MTLEVTRLAIPAILSNLWSGEWQIPKFQREFVWSQSQVYGLLHSVFKSRPVGLITIWEQPQGMPHTEAEPITLKTAVYKGFDQDPGIMKFVLDGRQRLTALAIAFGGLRESDARRGFSGRWFINLDADPEENEEKLIVYKKPSELDKEKLENPAICLASALMPLDECQKFDVYSGNVNNPDFYSMSKLPPPEVREARRQRLAGYEKTFLQFQIPVAALPKTVSLAQVCEIFDVLNQTGTKVSSFDLVHNNNYASTKGALDLRSVFNECPEKYNSLGLLCDPQRSEFFCQLVTACYLTKKEPLGRDKKLIRSIKGGDLVNTPTEFYLEIIENLPRIDSYCSGLFSADVLGGKFPLRLLPYPAGVLLFLSLRWAQDFPASEDDQYTTEDLTRVFRAFFWSNVFAGRYDQGFLSLFASDQKELKRILLQYKAYGDRQQWAEAIDKDFDKGMFSGTYSRAEQKEIEQDLLNGELRGAKRQAIIIFLLSGTKTDLATGAKLDYLSEDKERKVQLHHIYPKQWCKNNKGPSKILANPDSVNCAANLVPLSPASNNAWMTRSPATAVQHFELEYDDTDPRFGNAFINREMFECLAKDSDPEEFWSRRASLLAERLHSLQYVARG